MDGRPTWTDCDEAGDYVVPNVLSPRDLVFRPDTWTKLYHTKPIDIPTNIVHDRQNRLIYQSYLSTTDKPIVSVTEKNGRYTNQ